MAFSAAAKRGIHGQPDKGQFCTVIITRDHARLLHTSLYESRDQLEPVTLGLKRVDARSVPYTARSSPTHTHTHTYIYIYIYVHCHFHSQRPRCVSSKCTCAHLCAHGCTGLKMRCEQVHCWRIAILRQHFHHRPTKTWSKVSGTVFSC